MGASAVVDGWAAGLLLLLLLPLFALASAKVGTFDAAFPSCFSVPTA
jgi:hypothetical protein